MATKRPVGKTRGDEWYGSLPAAKSSFVQAEFIQYELSAEETRTCKGWEYSESDAFDALLKLQDAKYKVTFRWDEYGQCYGCWLLPDKTDPDNAGLILTGRGTTPFKALKQVCFKHYMVFSGAWPKPSADRMRPEIDD